MGRAIRERPSLARSHTIRGDALTGLGDLQGALASYRRALRLAGSPEEKNSIRRPLAGVHYALGDPKRAYRHLLAAHQRWDLEASLEDLHRLARLAAEAGHYKDSRKLARFALAKAPPSSPARAELEHLASRGSLSP